MCGAPPQNQHRAPQIFIFFGNINIVPFIHLRVALFLPVILVHTRTQRQARIHAKWCAGTLPLIGLTAESPAPLNAPTKANPSGIFAINVKCGYSLYILRC